MEGDYRIWELDVKLAQEQFREMIDYIKSQGYVIPGVITDYNNDKVIVIGRKPTAEELAQQTQEQQ